MSEKKKLNLGLKILIVIISIIGVIALLLFGTYAYIKYSLKIDIFDIKNKLELLSQDYQVSAFITNPYNEENTANAFQKLFDKNNVYYNDGSHYIFNKAEFDESSLTGIKNLSDKETAGLFQTLISKLESSRFSQENDLTKSFDLKQIKFSNFSTSTSGCNLDITYTLEIGFPKTLSDVGGIVNSLFGNLIPDKFYVTSNFSLQVENNTYSITKKAFCINALNSEQSNGILQTLGTMLGEPLQENLELDLNESFCQLLLGDETTNGVVDNINGCTGYEFKLIDDKIVLEFKNL